MTEFNILKCFECETFQVDQVKKAKKWTCKVCNAKQSIKKIYFTSGAGRKFQESMLMKSFSLRFHVLAKDCRVKAQEMNVTYHQTKSAAGEVILQESERQTENFNDQPAQEVRPEVVSPPSNKWSKFSKPKPASPQSQRNLHKNFAQSTSFNSKRKSNPAKNIFKPHNSSEIATHNMNHHTNYSISYEKTSAPLPKSIDNHNPPTSTSKNLNDLGRDSSSVAPPQKRMKQIDEILDDDLVISQEDWQAIVSLM